MYPCNCLACSAHVPQNLKCNKKFKKRKKERKIDRSSWLLLAIVELGNVSSRKQHGYSDKLSRGSWLDGQKRAEESRNKEQKVEKNEIHLFATTLMELKIILLSEISQNKPGTERQASHVLTICRFGWKKS